MISILNKKIRFTYVNPRGVKSRLTVFCKDICVGKSPFYQNEGTFIIVIERKREKHYNINKITNLKILE